MNTVILKPRLSEKAYALSQTKNVYAFDVSKDVNKQYIAEAVTAQFNVGVESVKVANVKGKVKRSVRRGGRQTYGKRSDFKKAYVTLKAGDSIPIFAAEEEADKKASKGKKA